MNGLKKISLIFVLFSLVFVNSAFSQEEKKTSSIDYAHQINIGYGAPNSFFTSMVNKFPSLFKGCDGIEKNNTSIENDYIEGPGVFQLGYEWYPLDWLSVGAACTYEPFKIIHKDTTTNPSFFWSVQGKVGFHYGWELVRLYHGISLGIGFCHSKETPSKVFFAYNLIPIGIEVGKGKGVYGFVDIGIGTTAYVNTGIGYRFPK